jgi:hypothetical protein
MSTAPSVENRVAWAMKDPFCNCCPGGVRDAQTVELARQGNPVLEELVSVIASRILDVF